jgi:hypothetical protein
MSTISGQIVNSLSGLIFYSTFNKFKSTTIYGNLVNATISGYIAQCVLNGPLILNSYNVDNYLISLSGKINVDKNYLISLSGNLNSRVKTLENLGINNLNNVTTFTNDMLAPNITSTNGLYVWDGVNNLFSSEVTGDTYIFQDLQVDRNITANNDIMALNLTATNNIQSNRIYCENFRTNYNGFSMIDYSAKMGNGTFDVYDASGNNFLSITQKNTSTINTSSININGGLSINSYNRSLYPIISFNSTPFQVYCDLNTGSNDKVICNVPINIKSGIKVIYTSLPSTYTSDSSYISYIYKTSPLSASNVSIANNTTTNISSINLVPIGIWLINFQFRLTSTSSCTISSIQYDVSTTNNTFSYSNQFIDNVSTKTLTSLTSFFTQTGQRTIQLSSESTLYLNILLTYTGTSPNIQSSNSTACYFTATRIG